MIKLEIKVEEFFYKWRQRITLLKHIDSLHATLWIRNFSHAQQVPFQCYYTQPFLSLPNIYFNAPKFWLIPIPHFLKNSFLPSASTQDNKPHTISRQGYNNPISHYITITDIPLLLVMHYLIQPPLFLVNTLTQFHFSD
jgi:hypothetical protein